MAFAAELHAHGDRPAVITAEGTVSYRDLARQVDDAAHALGKRRRLVLLEAANDLTSLVGYLAALRGGHVALLGPRSAPEQIAELTELWDPDVVVGADGPRVRRTGSAHELHPDLALLLTTSGSTGAPRLVRLSAAAVDANAAAIGEYLGIRADDRAVTSLPMHYCYGLSVVNSNLRAGAALVLEDRSVSDAAFWTTVRERRATSLHGVPFSFELLDRVGFADMDLPHLRYVTQAGGRLAPDQVRKWARVGRKRGWALFVMYGQTEATARMAYLPPAMALEAPEAIGVAVPGGTLSIEPLDEPANVAEAEEDGVGEIVYRGPNVMLGYAEEPGDLALGRTVHELHTGDLGIRRPDGLIEIRGRRSRFVKPFGVRVDLDKLERLLAQQGVTAACTGTDQHLSVAVETTTSRTDVEPVGVARDVLENRLNLPATAASVVALRVLPRRPSGKVDHPAVARLAERAPAPAAEAVAPADSLGRMLPARLRGHLPGRTRTLTVREVFARTFPGRELHDGATFVDLGGDSLTYVQASADIERALGYLPEAWDTTTLGELADLAPRSRRRGSWATIEAVVLLRAAAILLVVGEHTHLWSWLGGAHLLLVVSGWTFARFLLAGPSAGATRDTTATPPGESAGPDRWGLTRRILRSAALIAVPSSLWIAFRATTQTDVHYADALLMGSVFHPLVQGYWFVGALVQILLVMAGLFALPIARRLDRRFPFGFPVAILGVAQLTRLLPERADIFAPDLYSTHLVAWLFVLGWVVHRARTPLQRWAVAAATLALVPAFFGVELERAAIVGVGLLVLMLVPRISLPRPLATAVSTVATASMGIYLTHFALLPLQFHGVRPALLVPLALALGVASWWVVDAVVRRVVTEVRVRRTSPLPRDIAGIAASPEGDRMPTPLP